MWTEQFQYGSSYHVAHLPQSHHTGKVPFTQSIAEKKSITQLWSVNVYRQCTRETAIKDSLSIFLMQIKKIHHTFNFCNNPSLN